MSTSPDNAIHIIASPIMFTHAKPVPEPAPAPASSSHRKPPFNGSIFGKRSIDYKDYYD